MASTQSITRIPGRPDALHLEVDGMQSQAHPKGEGKQTVYQESDQPVVVMKPVKAGGAKGVAVSRSPRRNISRTRGGSLWQMKQRE